MFSDLVLRIRALFKRTAIEHEIDEELRFHLDRQIEAYENGGLDHHEAVRRARLEFGGLDQSSIPLEQRACADTSSQSRRCLSVTLHARSSALI